MFKKQYHQIITTADVVDGVLILSMPEAVSPAVWQYDVSSSKDMTFQIEENGPDAFSFVALGVDADKKEIAVFADKETALAALMATSNALRGAHGKIKPVSEAVSANKAPFAAPLSPREDVPRGHMFAVTGGLLILAILVYITLSGGPQRIEMQDSNVTTPSGAQSNAAAVGEPVSADAFLMQR